MDNEECGFASCEIGNKITYEDQWKKLKLVRDIAVKYSVNNTNL